MSASARVAPSSDMRMAVARPIPEAAPVMMTTFPRNGAFSDISPVSHVLNKATPAVVIRSTGVRKGTTEILNVLSILWLWERPDPIRCRNHVLRFPLC